MSAAERHPTGSRLGRYTLLGKLATGGMAEVYLARQDGPRGFLKTVVVKTLLPELARDDHFVKMFLTEAKLAAQLNHPNIGAILELGQDAQSRVQFMIMEFIDGCTLKRYVQRAYDVNQPPSLGVCVRIVADICSGLDYAHNLKDREGRPLGLIHRDVSMENIMVAFNGVPKLVDFGVAKAASAESMTRTGQIKGKLPYMSPESILGNVLDRRVDLWALGVVLYWVACGRRPFAGTSAGDYVRRILQTEPPPLRAADPRVDAEYERIVLRSLSKKPEDRYSTAREMKEDLERWLVTSGQAASSLHVVDDLEHLFPVFDDPDRLRLQLLLSGDPDQPTTIVDMTAAQAPLTNSETTLPSHPPVSVVPGMTMLNMPATPSGIQEPGAMSPWNDPSMEATITGERRVVPFAMGEAPAPGRSWTVRYRGWLLGLLVIVLAAALGGGIGTWLRHIESGGGTVPLPEEGPPAAPLPPTPAITGAPSP
jgi:serine/threonine protein kinase